MILARTNKFVKSVKINGINVLTQELTQKLMELRYMWHVCQILKSRNVSYFQKFTNILLKD